MKIFRLYIRVLGQLGSERNLAILLVLANLALAIAAFAEPVLFGRIIDKLSEAQKEARAVSWSELGTLIGAWGAFGFFTIAASVLVAMHADRLSHRRRLVVMGQYFEHVLHLPLGFHSAVHSGRLLKTMLDGATSMAGLWLTFFRDNCSSFVGLFILLPATMFINWRLGALLVLLVFLFAGVMWWVLHHTERLQGKVEMLQTDLAERASDALGNVPVIQSFTRIQRESQALRSISDMFLAAQIPVLSWWALAAVATRAAATLTLLSIFLLGTWLYMHGLTTIGQIVTFMSFAGLLVGKLEQVVTFVNWMLMVAPKMQEYFDVLDTKPQVSDLPGARDIGRLEGRVIFDHVTFNYDARRIAVDDVSFDVSPGETIALVGATGSGKSTTLGLLHRVYDPVKGAVLIDGIDIRAMTLESLRRNIGVVFQEPMLFARSIEENIRVGKPDATDEEIELAVERAQAKDFIARQPDGLKTIVGERGRSLSGGERQRVAIARALLKDPPIMVFDEATSALDATTEKLLQAALEAAMQGRTTFIIAHRLATIRNASRILVFDQGKVVESGTFEELVALNGKFAALARAQFMADAPVPTAH
ncbi:MULTISPECIES: glucan ABC transporter ATP-binding protein/ permease [unclassified Beijerinckia]|uniref:glucan ABC transporter ATP-binding protein/ permease n=1 Tax=unclassified Beijerinckia TaxID=2638183 RepID=UPI0008954644|nr:MULTISPECIES: glucan ABC transporter ATP-binding protein/ permease [unclassified Beijerinckia]MDH7798123.1 glucan exporter ATP-binding protein [Beijerinckia sp. GAS462]SED09873.1 ATP-binding cassette, subfamily B [Beijerinckia sp. 28-YEA-48]